MDPRERDRLFFVVGLLASTLLKERTFVHLPTEDEALPTNEGIVLFDGPETPTFYVLGLLPTSSNV